ncbi:intercellular adhesion molecule 2-like [Melanotaenia boesemani]|uniref:intercellular adhesion molecule 2-like n=1 Tax=Melanotaenia boesemani TaxID=1250792 RepID=UPI001C0553A9|nr:intercellular adhesion molecule 2-like [Melanotaenia boesemani]
MRRLIIFSLLTLSPGLFASACEIEISPPSIVVRFGDSLLANCSLPSCKVNGIGWESSFGGIGLQTGVSSLPLKIEKVEAWEIEPQCYVNTLDPRTGTSAQLIEDLKVTVYQMPDSVFMSQASSKMVEGQQYLIECRINNVAPVSNLSMFWHKGNEIFHKETFKESSSSPHNVSSNYRLTAHRDDNENQIWCEAKLNLWPYGQGPPPMKSELRRMTVLYPPTFMKSANETVEVAAGGNVTLNCTATANPMPVYKWHFSDATQEEVNKQQMNEPILTLSFHLQGNYSCTASNSQGSTSKYFTVIETEGDRTAFIAIVTSLVLVGVLLVIGGLYFVKQDGTFSFKGRGPSEVI